MNYVPAVMQVDEWQLHIYNMEEPECKTTSTMAGGKYVRSVQNHYTLNLPDEMKFTTNLNDTN